MNTQTYKWSAPTHLPDGHRLFETYDGPEGGFAVAIADDSGITPDQTDDGVLWLDPSRCLKVAKDDSFGDYPREYMQIPVIVQRDGSRKVTGCDAATLLFLARSFKWTIKDEDNRRLFNVTR